jgi:hypothetical protein
VAEIKLCLISISPSLHPSISLSLSPSLHLSDAFGHKLLEAPGVVGGVHSRDLLRVVLEALAKVLGLLLDAVLGQNVDDALRCGSALFIIKYYYVVLNDLSLFRFRFRFFQNEEWRVGDKTDHVIRLVRRPPVRSEPLHASVLLSEQGVGLCHCLARLRVSGCDCMGGGKIVRVRVWGRVVLCA